MLTAEERKVEMGAEEFQGTILRSVEQHLFPYPVILKGINYVMFPETFNPNYAKASLLLLNNLGVKTGDVVLDPFTGCGADAVFAVLDGALRSVAVDKHTMPFLCAKYNVHRLGLVDKVDVRQGDLFNALLNGEKFDLIIANPPFKRGKSTSNISGALNDEHYNTLEKFWKEVKNYLTPDGRIRAVFSDVGDMDYFQRLASLNGFNSEVVARDKFGSDVKIEVYEFRL